MKIKKVYFMCVTLEWGCEFKTEKESKKQTMRIGRFFLLEIPEKWIMQRKRDQSGDKQNKHS